MNVRITPRGAPFRTDLYGGVRFVYSNDDVLFLVRTTPDSAAILDVTTLDRKAVADIALDDDPGDWW